MCIRDRRPHRCADPVDALDVEPRDQRDAVGEIKWEGVVRGVREPFAAPASGHVRADDAVIFRQSLGDRVEILGVTRQPMNADQGRCARRAGPFAVRNAVKTGWGEAGEMAFEHERETLMTVCEPVIACSARQVDQL